MKIHELTANKRQKRKRSGRGISAGRGKTAGRGTKGQNSRTGGGTRPGFEGGQNPLYARLPKFPGFKQRPRAISEVKTGDLDKKFKANDTVTTAKLEEAGLISNRYATVKLISGGEISKKLTVEVQAVSASAQAAIEKAGGTVSIVDRAKQAASSKQETAKTTKK